MGQSEAVSGLDWPARVIPHTHVQLSRFGIVVLIAVAFHCADNPSVAAQFPAKTSNNHVDNIASAERLLPNLSQQFVACHHAAGTL